MGKAKDIAICLKRRATELIHEGKSYRFAASILGISVGAVQGAVKNKTQHGRICKRKGVGRPKKLTPRDVRTIVIAAKLKPFATHEEMLISVQNRIPPITVRTFLNYLKREGLRSPKAKSKPFVNAYQRLCRLHWARELLLKPSHFWTKVVYSDETRIMLYCNDGRVRVTCRKGEEYHPKHVNPTIKHGLSLTLWACISYNGVGRLRILGQNEKMNAQWYIRVLQEEVLPSLLQLYPGRMPFFQDDGAPCHRATTVVRRRTELRIKHLPWVGQSPDVNPIENLWSFLKHRVRKRHPKTRTELIQVVSEVWNNEISLSLVRKLCFSVPRRLRQVVVKRGFQTKY